jgi:hypothetical protein
VAAGTDRQRRTWIALALGAALAAPAPAARADTVVLRWRHPAPAQVVGFRAHVGGAPGAYTRTIDLGRPAPGADGVFRATVELADGEGTHLAVSAYDASGRESTPSNEWVRPPALGRPGRPEVVEP